MDSSVKISENSGHGNPRDNKFILMIIMKDLKNKVQI